MLLFEQALRVDRPPWPLGFATPRSLPATQEQRWRESDRDSAMPNSRLELDRQKSPLHQNISKI